MVTHGIKDKVAVIGCDATKYGELWDKSKDSILYCYFTNLYCRSNYENLLIVT